MRTVDVLLVFSAAMMSLAIATLVVVELAERDASGATIPTPEKYHPGGGVDPFGDPQAKCPAL